MTLLLSAHPECALRGTTFTELRDAHLEVADIASRIDLDDAASWATASPVIARITSAAYEMTAAVTGGPAAEPASAVPPIVRIRELATAQLRLFGALETHHPDAVLRLHADASAAQVRRLGRLLVRR